MKRDDSPILLLYYSPSCGFCDKVLRFIEENNLTVPLKNIEEDPAAKEELLLLGGKSQVPCLFIDGAPLYESRDVIDFLEKARVS